MPRSPLTARQLGQVAILPALALCGVVAVAYLLAWVGR